LTKTNSAIQPDLALARRRAALSVALNMALGIVKGTVGIMANSTAMISDAIHSATDVLGAGAAWVGLWLAGRKHPSFPYGLYKAETVATLAISMAVLLAAYEIGRKAVFGPDTMPETRLALPTSSGALIVTLVFGLYQLKSGKRLNSPALIADARDYLADCLSTGVVILGLIGAHFGYSLDRWAAAVVALFVFRSGGHLMLMALKDLMDASIDRNTEKAIIKKAESHPQVIEVEQCFTRTAGGRFLVDMDVILRTPSAKIADRVSDRLEEEIIRTFPRIAMVRISPHYGHASSIRVITPVEAPGGGLCCRLGTSPWFQLEVIDRHNGKTLEREFIQNPYQKEEKKRGYLVGNWLLGLKPDRIIVPEKQRGTAFALLEQAGVEIEKRKKSGREEAGEGTAPENTDRTN